MWLITQEFLDQFFKKIGYVDFYKAELTEAYYE